MVGMANRQTPQMSGPKMQPRTGVAPPPGIQPGMMPPGPRPPPQMPRPMGPPRDPQMMAAAMRA